MKTAIKLFSLLALALLPGITLAGQINPYGETAWTIWAFGNGNALANILTGASTMLKPGGAYFEFIVFMAITGGIVLAVVAANSHGSARKMIAGFLVMAAVLSIGINTTGDVVIQDEVNKTVNTVRSVPTVLFLPVAVVTTVGHNITEALETYYSMPSDLTMTGAGGGFNMANSLIQASTKITVTDPLFRATMEQFSENCIIPSLAAGRISATQMINAPVLFGSGSPLANINPSPLTNVFTDNNPAGVLVSCGAAGAQPGSSASNSTPSVTANNAYDYITNYMKSIASNYAGASAYTNTPIFGFMTAASLANAQTQLSGGVMSSNGAASIEQAAAINVLNPSLNAAAVASGNSSMVTAMAVSQGETTQKTGWATAGIMFQNLSGYMYSVLQAFLIALSPLVVAALFFPGAGLGIAKNYLQVVIWLALWEPMLSIVNYLINLFSAGPFGSSLGQYAGYTMMNMPIVSEQTANMTAAAGFLAASVPMIAWGLVKGGMAFTEFLSKGMGASLAAAAAQTAATGNISLNNQSYNNRTLDKWAMDAVTTTGSVGAITNESSLDSTLNTHTANANSYVGGTNTTVTGTQTVQVISSSGLSAVNSATQSAARELSHAATSTLALLEAYGSAVQQTDRSVSGTTNTDGAGSVSKAVNTRASDTLDKLSNSTSSKENAELMAAVAVNAATVGSAIAGRASNALKDIQAAKTTTEKAAAIAESNAVMKDASKIAKAKGMALGFLTDIASAIQPKDQAQIKLDDSKSKNAEQSTAIAAKSGIDNADSIEAKTSILKTIDNTMTSALTASEQHNKQLSDATSTANKSLDSLNNALSRMKSTIASNTVTETITAPLIKSAGEASSYAGDAQGAAVQARDAAARLGADNPTDTIPAMQKQVDSALDRSKRETGTAIPTPNGVAFDGLLYNQRQNGVWEAIQKDGTRVVADGAALRVLSASHIGQTGSVVGQSGMAVNRGMSVAQSRFNDKFNQVENLVIGGSIAGVLGNAAQNIDPSVIKKASDAAKTAGNAFRDSAAARMLTGNALAEGVAMAEGGAAAAALGAAGVIGYGTYESAQNIGTMIYNRAIAGTNTGDAIGAVEAGVLAAMGITSAQQAILDNNPTGYDLQGNITPAGAAANARQAVDYFKSQGWSENAAKGIVTNLFAESSMNPRAVNPNGIAAGLAQWTSKNRRIDAATYALEQSGVTPQTAREYAQSMSQQELTNTITGMSFDQQLAYVNQELNSVQYSGLARTLRNSNISAYDAAKAVSIQYEAPGTGDTPQAVREANQNIGEGRGQMAENFNQIASGGKAELARGDIPNAFNFDRQRALAVQSNPDAGNTLLSETQSNAIAFGMGIQGNKFAQAAIENQK